MPRPFNIEATSSDLQLLIDQANQTMSDVQRRELSSRIRAIISRMPDRPETQGLYEAGERAARLLNRQITESALRQLHELNGELSRHTALVGAIRANARSAFQSAAFGTIADVVDDANAIQKALRGKEYPDAIVHTERVLQGLTAILRDLSDKD